MSKTLRKKLQKKDGSDREGEGSFKGREREGDQVSRGEGEEAGTYQQEREGERKEEGERGNAKQNQRRALPVANIFIKRNIY